jgi:hypothetical protein
MRVPLPAEACHDLNPALFHAPQSQHAVGDALQAIGPAANDDDLQAQVVVDVNVQGRAHLLAQLVLKLRQLLAEVAHMVIVDQGQRRDGIHGLGHLGPPYFGPGQIAKQLRACAATVSNHTIEIAQQRAFKRYPESNQSVFHRG